MRVEQMTSSKGNPIANQFIIKDCEGYNSDGLIGKRDIYFQSYHSIIVKLSHTKEGLKVFLDVTYWDYSRTTGKYRNKFLGENKAETMKKIKSGEYILTDLNSLNVVRT